MKAIIILSFVTMAYATGCAYAHPGGYLAKGGVVGKKNALKILHLNADYFYVLSVHFLFQISKGLWIT